MFDSNVKPLINGLEFFDHYKEKIPAGMKRNYIFYEIPSWEHHKIVHLLDPMHILKNGSSSIWRHLSSRKSDTLASMGVFISSNIKKKHWTKRKIEDRLVTLGLLKKVMSHGF